MRIKNLRRSWAISAMRYPEELATYLTEWKWALCSGFDLKGKIIALNVTAEDKATDVESVHEFAIVKPVDTGCFAKVGSMRVGNTEGGDGSYEIAFRAIQRFLKMTPKAGPERLTTNPCSLHGTCRLCS